MTSPDAIVEALRDGILSLRYRPGAPLREVELAQQFHASRRSVRESLLRLDREGVVTHERNRGARVAMLRPSSVRDLYRARRALEGFGAGCAVGASEEAIARVTDALEVLTSTARSGQDTLAHAKSDMLFHASIIALAENPHLDRLFSEVSVEMTFAIRLLHRDEVVASISADEVIGEHARICDAVRSRDDGLARHLVARHIDLNEARLMDLVGSGFLSMV